LLAPQPAPRAEGTLLVGCLRLLIQYIHSYTPSSTSGCTMLWWQRPTDGDRDPLTMSFAYLILSYPNNGRQEFGSTHILVMVLQSSTTFPRLKQQYATVYV